MATRRVSGKEPPETTPKKIRPATTPEARENQLVALAVDLVEKQMREGTASSQVITHYLKLGSSRERLEQERLANENSFTKAKIEMMESAKKVEHLYGMALEAMRSYSGQAPLELEIDFE